MRILDKKTINETKSLERKKEVEEGMKLAKTVDSLRETKSKEESNLAKFRAESLKIIKGEVDSLIGTKNAVQAEITAMEAKRIELAAPVDLTKEWNDVRLLRQELSDREVNLISRETLVQNLEKREIELSKREQEATNYLNEARKSYTKTDDLRSEMESRKVESDTVIHTKFKDLTDKEQDLIKREEVIKKQQEELAIDSRELIDKGASLINRESKVEVDTKLLFERDQAIKEKETLAQRYLNETSINYDQSENIKLETQKLLDESKKAIHQRYIDLAEKEREFGYKERDFILQRERLDREMKEVEKEKIHIASQQQTLRTTWAQMKILQAKKN